MPDSSPHQPQPTHVGNLGEALVVQWLRQQGHRILAQQWHSRWGELDIIAQTLPGAPASSAAPPTLIFVEVKTRSHRNWDANGLLAIPPQKQAKLWKTAQLFLTKQPDLMALPCRFDVALVQCYRDPLPAPTQHQPWPPNIKVQAPIPHAGYVLTLWAYFEAAFSGDTLGTF